MEHITNSFYDILWIYVYHKYVCLDTTSLSLSKLCYPSHQQHISTLYFLNVSRKNSCKIGIPHWLSSRIESLLSDPMIFYLPDNYFTQYSIRLSKTCGQPFRHILGTTTGRVGTPHTTRREGSGDRNRSETHLWQRSEEAFRIPLA